MTFLAEIVKSQFYNRILKLNKDYGFSNTIRPVMCVVSNWKTYEVPDKMMFYFSEN
jgi:hypothetical protein